MDHYSMEVIGKERQRNLLANELNDRKVRNGRSSRRYRAGRLIVIILTFLLLYFWLIV